MFQKVAGEHSVQLSIGQWPRFSAVLLKNGNAGRSLFSYGGVEVHCIFLAGVSVIDEFTVTGAKVKNSSSIREPLREEWNQHPPDPRSVLAFAGKARLIYPL